ncbi:hypothetical protein LTR36_000427 [Oleoguttula mirabilis]|uniref:Early meiotic induction protein 1 n=1 Tax=Oleoguttula mirabilis TaxID=1507867 RepID=A0AAV9K075_9PEZI|nr:hypothetical protein LTR36_000427 [Oleoguttula mirabilis]
MGWLWSSSPRPAADKPASLEGVGVDAAPVAPAEPQPRNFALTDEQRTRIFGQLGARSSSNASREEKADAELDAFLQSFAAPDSTASAPSTVTSPDGQAPNHAPPQQTRPAYDRLLPDGSINIHPTATYPRAMSCRQAFDQAFYCQSLGGKFNDIYRYGHLKDCSEQWGAFWFCMRARQLPDKDKEPMISDYYAERDERRRKEFGNSENIWELREKAVERAFWRDPDADEEGHDVQVRE